MNSARVQFHSNIERVRALGGVGAAVTSLTTAAVDVSDIWRAQIVLIVSALDQFIHELTRLGMIECAKGIRPKTDAFLRFNIPLSAVDLALNGTSYEVWVGETVQSKHSWQSFQDPDKLAEAIRLFSPIGLWDRVGNELSMNAKDVKTRLKLIVDRRNQIAHEADLDPANPGFRWPINEPQVNYTIDFIEQLGEAIFKVSV